MSEHPMITCTPGVQGGYPCIAGTRTPVRSIVEYFKMYEGDTAEILRGLPHLTIKQIQGALRYYEECPELVDEDIARQEAAYQEFLASGDPVVVPPRTESVSRQRPAP